MRAVVGSANLTGALATNVEAAVALAGTARDRPPVHRSSAVCAILARIPGVRRARGREIVLRFSALR
jgi:hypothetical protein